MKLDVVVLAVLAGRPMSGYDLMKWFDVEGQFFRSAIHHSQIYRTLGRMVTDGLVAFEVDPREGRPDAKVYRLTEIGRTVLLDWAGSPYQAPSRFQDSDCRMRLSLAGALDLDATVRAFEAELEFRRDQVARNRGRDRTLAFHDAVPGLDRTFAQELNDLNHAYGMAAVDQWIAWVDSTLHTLRTAQEARR